MKYFLVLSMVLFSLSSYIHADSKIFKSKLDILELHEVYESTGIPGEYEKTSHNEKIRIRVYLKRPGEGEELVSDDEEEISTVPGVDGEGHSKLKLVNLDGKVYLSVEQLFKDTGENFSHLSQYNAEVRLVEGTWEDYQNGRDLTLKLTLEGHQTILENFVEEFKAYMEEAFEKNVEVKIDNMGVYEIIKANLSKIEILIEKISFSAIVTVTGE